ncbi:MAG: hypothetical protein ACLSG5_14875 [Oscillospiraceae bacterium]
MQTCGKPRTVRKAGGAERTPPEVKERIGHRRGLEPFSQYRGPRGDRFVVEDELKKLRQNAAELASIEAQLSDVKKYIELESCSRHRRLKERSADPPLGSDLRRRPDGD